MNAHESSDIQMTMQAVEPSDLETVEGGLGLFPNYIPLGDRSVVGCGTMILIDRMLGRMVPTRV
jgi:hypothetical protein